MSTAIAGAVPAYITREILEDRDACADQVELFALVFPAGGEVTAANIRRAAAAGLDLDWFVETFLPEPARRAYDEATAAARRAYVEATAAAGRAYDEATTAARRAYDEATAAARRAYDEATTPARRAYDEADVAAWRAYVKATAAARRAYREATTPAGRAYREATTPVLIDALGLTPGSGRSD